MARAFVATAGPKGWKLGRWCAKSDKAWEEEKLDKSATTSYQFAGPSETPGSKTVRLTTDNIEVLLCDCTAIVFENGKFSGEFLGRWEVNGVAEPPPPQPKAPKRTGTQKPEETMKASPGASGAPSRGKKAENLDRSPMMVEQLHAAAKTGDAVTVKSLLGKNVDPDATGQDGTTPLFAAATKGSLPCVQALLEAGADPNIGKKGNTPMTVAFQKGHKEVLKALFGSTFQSLESIMVSDKGLVTVDVHAVQEDEEVPDSAVYELWEVTKKLADLGTQNLPTLRSNTDIPGDPEEDSEMMRQMAIRDAMKSIAKEAKA